MTALGTTPSRASVRDAPYSPMYSEGGLRARRPTADLGDPATADFVIACEGKELHVHRDVLMRGSPFLARFLNSDPLCTRINANNASATAMDLVLRSLYFNPPPGNEFGAYLYNPGVVTSVWEIAMHFQIDGMAAAATSRLLQLIDKECAFRVLKATLKHPASSHAKSLQRHLAAVALPPVLEHDQEVAWRQMVDKVPWIQDAIDELARAAATRAAGESARGSSRADDERDHVATSAATPVPSEHGDVHKEPIPSQQPQLAPATPTNTVAVSESISALRDTYQKYMSLRASNAGRALPDFGIATTPPPSDLNRSAGAGDDSLNRYVYGNSANRHQDPSPAAIRGVEDGDDVTIATAALSASAMKLRDFVSKAQDDLAELASAAAHSHHHEHNGDDAPKSTAAMRPDMQRLADEVRRQIAETKEQYGDEMRQHRQQKAQLESAAAEERKRDDEDLAKRRRHVERELQRVQSEVATLHAAIEATEHAEAEAQQFVEHAQLYVTAARRALDELRAVAKALPTGAPTVAARRHIASHVSSAKQQRDACAAALDDTLVKKERACEQLVTEHATTERLQRVLAQHEADDVNEAVAGYPDHGDGRRFF